ncbi:MAG: RNA-binding protein S4 [Sneathiella sp.]|nr:MAG: RNA-binding protein S4 [Sneathiella sp.]
MGGEGQVSSATVRVDKWLWFARFFKSRSIAAKQIQSRKVRVNSVIAGKTSTLVKAEDILTFPQEKDIRVVRIIDIGVRRGPATEARLLYEDLTPLEPKKIDKTSMAGVPLREPGSGRPTKADRRAIDKLRPNPDET